MFASFKVSYRQAIMVLMTTKQMFVTIEPLVKLNVIKSMVVKLELIFIQKESFEFFSFQMLDSFCPQFLSSFETNAWPVMMSGDPLLNAANRS